MIVTTNFMVKIIFAMAMTTSTIAVGPADAAAVAPEVVIRAAGVSKNLLDDTRT
jgi:hypothetical protein